MWNSKDVGQASGEGNHVSPPLRCSAARISRDSASPEHCACPLHVHRSLHQSIA